MDAYLRVAIRREDRVADRMPLLAVEAAEVFVTIDWRTVRRRAPVVSRTDAVRAYTIRLQAE